ncbi:MAG: response regulator [Azonexus sp.]
MKILIIEDNASMRSLLVTLFNSQGYQVVGELDNGSTLLDDIHRLRPQIVCLDYQLPGKNGLELLRTISEHFPEVDVVFMTSSEDGEIEKQAADTGAAGFLRKPFGQKQIIDEIQQICALRRQAVAADSHEGTPAGAPRKTGGARNTKRPTAVLVDDNSSIRFLLKGILVEYGMDVVGQASNGEEAIRAAESHQPSVLFLDVNMPILSGLDALPQIRTASPRTAVVMVTGNATRELVQQAAGLGACGYIVKPVRPAYVHNFLNKLFHR